MTNDQLCMVGGFGAVAPRAHLGARILPVLISRRISTMGILKGGLHPLNLGRGGQSRPPRCGVSRAAACGGVRAGARRNVMELAP